MRHNKKFNHLGRKAAHRKSMLSNMACSLIKHKRIQTTTAKAKALLDKGVTINKVNGKDTLLTIAPADGSYKVNFGKEEFETYFKNFLRPQLIEMLF